MNYTEAELRRDFELAQQRALGFYPGAFAEVSSRVAWQLYQNVASAPLGLQIVGRRLIGAEPAIAAWNAAHPDGGQMPDELVGIGATEIQNFGGVDEVRSGSVLEMSKDRWNLTINDVWLLAAVHSGQEFHGCGPSPFRERDVLHPSFVCTLLGRELVGLAMAGYRETRQPLVGTAYVCDARTPARSMTLLGLQRQMESLTTREQVLGFLAGAGFVIVP